MALKTPIHANTLFPLKTNNRLKKKIQTIVNSISITIKPYFPFDRRLEHPKLSIADLGEGQANGPSLSRPLSGNFM